MAFERSQKDPTTKNKCTENLVNEIRPYEQLIASKLDQLVVPDMSDAIWAGIEGELDAPPEGPGDRGSGGAGPGLRFKGPGWWGFAGVVVVLAALFLWYFGRKGPEPAAPSKTLPTQQTPAPPVEKSREPDAPERKRRGPVAPVETRKDSVSLHKVPDDSVRVDSVVRQAAPFPKVDSAAFQRTRPALPDVDLYSTPPAPPPGMKKQKGVKGITEDDYKISAGKDSERKKN